MRLRHIVLIMLLSFITAGCSLRPPASFTREQHVDISRYMGPWYVIAHIAPSKTKNAYNEIERYSQESSGKIKTVFTYREGSFDGKQKTIKPTGYVIDGTGNAVWGMQFIWPLKLQFVISYVSPKYKTTIVARSKRDYVWIMARTPKISDKQFQALVTRVKNLGYDTSKLLKVPQQPLSERNDLHAGTD